MSPATRGGGTFKYSNAGEESGVNQLVGVVAATAPNSPCVMIFHKGGWFERTLGNSNEAGKGLVLGQTEAALLSTEGHGPLQPYTNMVEYFHANGYAVFVCQWDQESSTGVTVNPGFPKEPEQCVEALEWMVAEASRFNGNSSRCFSAGFSAGGHLAQIASVLLNRKRGERTIKAVHSSSGVTDMVAIGRYYSQATEGGQHTTGLTSLPTHIAWAMNLLKVGTKPNEEPGTLNTLPWPTSNQELGEHYSAGYQVANLGSLYAPTGKTATVAMMPHMLLAGSELDALTITAQTVGKAAYEAASVPVTQYTMAGSGHAEAYFINEVPGTGKSLREVTLEYFAAA